MPKLLERKGLAFVLFDLIQNAWDERCSRVDVALERIEGTKHVRLVVEDNHLAGFADLVARQASAFRPGKDSAVPVVRAGALTNWRGPAADLQGAVAQWPGHPGQPGVHESDVPHLRPRVR